MIYRFRFSEKDLSEAESLDCEKRRRRAEAGLAASRPLREVAAAGHARDIALANGEKAAADGDVASPLEL